jgi:hypothetical protein
MASHLDALLKLLFAFAGMVCIIRGEHDRAQSFLLLAIVFAIPPVSLYRSRDREP